MPLDRIVRAGLQPQIRHLAILLVGITVVGTVSYMQIEECEARDVLIALGTNSQLESLRSIT